MSLESFLDSHSKQHIIFDFDVTLFTLHLPWNLYYKEIRDVVHTFDPSIQRTGGINDFENEAVQRCGDDIVKLRQELTLKFESKYLERITEHFDMTNFVRKHHKKYFFYLWTSNMRQTVEPILEEHGLLQHFKKLATKGDVRLTKPFADGFDLLFDSQKDDKSEWLLVGDSSADKGAAKNSGIDFWMRPEP